MTCFHRTSPRVRRCTIIGEKITRLTSGSTAATKTPARDFCLNATRATGSEDFHAESEALEHALTKSLLRNEATKSLRSSVRRFLGRYHKRRMQKRFIRRLSRRCGKPWIRRKI
jgi:hypothetical protein